MKLKVVIDTNCTDLRHYLARHTVWAAEMSWERLLDNLYKPWILAEVNRVLNYSKFQKYIDREKASPGELFGKIASLCTIIYPKQEVKKICSDKDDQIFLSCALAAKAGILISCDKHLLNIKKYKSVRILTAQEFYIENIRNISWAIEYNISFLGYSEGSGYLKKPSTTALSRQLP